MERSWEAVSVCELVLILSAAMEYAFATAEFCRSYFAVHTATKEKKAALREKLLNRINSHDGRSFTRVLLDATLPLDPPMPTEIVMEGRLSTDARGYKRAGYFLHDALAALAEPDDSANESSDQSSDEEEPQHPREIPQNHELPVEEDWDAEIEAAEREREHRRMQELEEEELEEHMLVERLLQPDPDSEDEGYFSEQDNL